MYVCVFVDPTLMKKLFEKLNETSLYEPAKHEAEPNLYLFLIYLLLIFDVAFALVHAGTDAAESSSRAPINSEGLD